MKTIIAKVFFLLVLSFILLTSCNQMNYSDEVQLTNDLSYNHDLDNNDNFSPDDQWLVYDTRTDEGGIGANARIEKVNVQSGEKVVLYALKQNQAYGPGVGAVSYSHIENKVVFIHGLLNITAENPYQQWRRTGVIIDDANPGVPIFMDARDISFPYTPGALRGGTHRHEWSGDGQWIGYTYNDAVMKHLEDSTGEIHNLRSIGVSKYGTPVSVESDPEGENISGEWFSAIVVQVVANPTPGSDEISRAAGDSWVGTSGYKKQDGTFQRARGFIGTIKDQKGNDLDEVFIVDIPEDISVPGTHGPLEGTYTEIPAPPLGASQRRLTFTADSEYPGCIGIVRSSPDGSMLSYLAFDVHGIKQLFTISPFGGTPFQITNHDSDVQSGARWSPDGTKVCYIWGNSIIIHDIENHEYSRLTKTTEVPPTNPVWSHDGQTIAYNRLVTNEAGIMSKQVFIVKL